MSKRYSNSKLVGLGFEDLPNDGPETETALSPQQYLSVAPGLGSPSLGSINRRGSFSIAPHSAPSIDTGTTPSMSQPPSPLAHNRQVSLTSACLPATASYAPDRKSYDDLSTARASPSLRSASDFKDSGPRKPWKPFAWFAAPADEKSPETPLMSGEPPKLTRSKSGGYNHQGPKGFLCLPYAVVAPLLGPFASTLLSQPASGSKPPGQPKKPRLAYRLFQMCYVLFSLLYLTTHILGLSPFSNSSTDKRLIPRQSDASVDQIAVGGWQDFAKGLKDRIPVRLGYGSNAAAQAPTDPVSQKWSESGCLPVYATNKSLAGEVTSAEQNPLTLFSHPYRFSKMHAKVSGAVLDEIEPFAFRGERIENRGDVTACLYSNEAWLDQLPEFVKRWNGPISLIFESLHARNSPARVDILDKISDMRSRDADFRSFVDVHFISKVPTSEVAANRSRERLITSPIASNFEINLARFFARTDMVWLANDARLLPSPGLRRKLTVPSVRKLVMSMGDALVIPTFAALRKQEDTPTEDVPTLRRVRTQVGVPQVNPGEGVSEDEFADLAAGYTSALHSSLWLPVDKWPKRKTTLVGLSSSHPPASVMNGETPPPGPIFAMYDSAWDVGRGPSNWPLWRKGSVDPRLSEGPEAGGGAGLGINGGIGGGHVVYKVADYELHYSPSVVISRDGQPWCTERFEYNKAACVYQMYLSGAELWVLPDEWAFTLEPVDAPEPPKLPASLELKETIASRLYIKYQSEGCMHFGREFLSMNMWNHPRAQHLRSICDKVSQAWGLESTGA